MRPCRRTACACLDETDTHSVSQHALNPACYTVKSACLRDARASFKLCAHVPNHASVHHETQQEAQNLTRLRSRQCLLAKYENKQEAIDAFKAMLEERCPSHTSSWADVAPLCQYDVRIRALKSTGEKKNVFENFITQKAKAFIDKVPAIPALDIRNRPSRVLRCGAENDSSDSELSLHRV